MTSEPSEVGRVDAGRLARRIALFGVLQLVGLVAPVLGLPVVARVGTEAEWVGIGVGQAVGVFAQILVMWGWAAAGPTRFALLHDERRRSALYRESLMQRLVLFAVTTPPTVCVAMLAAPSGGRLIAALAVVAGTAAGLSPSWFYMSQGRPVMVALSFDLPMAAAVILSATFVLIFRLAWTYSILQIVVALACPLVILQVLHRQFGDDAGESNVRIMQSFRDQWPIAVSNVIGIGYSNMPLPLASALTSSGVASLNSADKIFRLASYAPSVLVNALQAWVLEGKDGYRRRQTIGILLHLCLGIFGLGGIFFAGPTIGRILFGGKFDVHGATLLAYGVAFLFVSLGAAINRLVLIPAGRARVVLAAGVMGAICGVAAAVTLTVSIGASGAAWGLACSEVAVIFVTLGAASKSIGRYPQAKVAEHGVAVNLSV